jgi:predicted transcriptional regulator
MLRVRLTQKQSDELDSIIAELQAQMPEASVTTSSIARYALEKYVSEYIAKRDGTKISIEVSTADATDEDIKNLYNLMSKMLDDAKENYSQTVHYMAGEIFEPVMMKMASLMKPKKPEVK